MILLILYSFPAVTSVYCKPETSLPRNQVRNPTSSNLILSNYRESSNHVFLVLPEYVGKGNGVRNKEDLDDRNAPIIKAQ